MPVPKKKTSKTKKRMRRAHHALPKTRLIKCANCGAKKRPHIVCPKCGSHKGRKVVDTRTRKEKKAGKKKAKKPTKSSKS